MNKWNSSDSNRYGQRTICFKKRFKRWALSHAFSFSFFVCNFNENLILYLGRLRRDRRNIESWESFGKDFTEEIKLFVPPEHLKLSFIIITLKEMKHSLLTKTV
jgi:hypothetical protein